MERGEGREGRRGRLIRRWRGKEKERKDGGKEVIGDQGEC